MGHFSEEYEGTPCVGWPVDESEDDSDWEEVDEEMEGIITDGEETLVPDLPDPPVHQHLALTLLCDKNVHHKVRRVAKRCQCILLPHPLCRCSAGVFLNFQ